MKSRPAVVGEKLVTTNFGYGTSGFAPKDDANTAVCVLPGTELAFDEDIRVSGMGIETVPHKTARFRQIRKDEKFAHHDMLEFPDGRTSMLTSLVQGQHATVLQLPAAPKNEIEREEQRRAEFV